jgi:hypothetical protein
VLPGWQQRRRGRSGDGLSGCCLWLQAPQAGWLLGNLIFGCCLCCILLLGQGHA